MRMVDESFWAGRRVLVTGHRGLVGSAIVVLATIGALIGTLAANGNDDDKPAAQLGEPRSRARHVTVVHADDDQIVGVV